MPPRGKIEHGVLDGGQVSDRGAPLEDWLAVCP